MIRDERHNQGASGQRPKLLVIGGGVLQRDSSHSLVSKSAVIGYLHQLATFFESTTWATSLETGVATFQSPLQMDLVQPLVIQVGRKGLISACVSLGNAINRNTVVLLYLPNPWLSAVGLALRPFYSTLAVYIANDYRMHSRLTRDKRGSLYSSLYRASHELPIRLADGVITRGVTLATRAKSLNRNVIETVPIGLAVSTDQECPVPVAGDDEFRALYVGKVSRQKGVDVLLRAFATVHTEAPTRSVTLTVVGAGDQLESLRNMARELHLDDCVFFRGYVDDPARLEKIYRRSDLLVVPSSDYPEGVPRVIEEAMACGLPVIASHQETIAGEFSSGEVLLVPTGDSAALGQAILRVATNPSLKSSLSAASLAHVRQRSGLTAAEQHAHFLLKMHDRRRS